MIRCERGQLDPGPYAIRGTLPYDVSILTWSLVLNPYSFLSQHPPNIQPATTFLTHFLSLLSSPSSSSKSIFLSTLPSQTSFSPPDIHLTTSPTLNFLQLALITVQRAPAVGTSGVQARGMDGGIGREWESLVGRYRRMSGAKGLLGDKEVQEVSWTLRHRHRPQITCLCHSLKIRVLRHSRRSRQTSSSHPHRRVSKAICSRI